jgi:hypothetical protein
MKISVISVFKSSKMSTKIGMMAGMKSVAKTSLRIGKRKKQKQRETIHGTSEMQLIPFNGIGGKTRRK